MFQYFRNEIRKNPLKVSLNLLLLSASVFFLFEMFGQLLDGIIGKIFMLVISIGLEFFGQYVLASAKKYWRESKRLIAVFVSSLYALYAVAVVIATIVFALSRLSASGASVDTYNYQRETIIESIEANREQIRELQAQRRTITNYGIHDRQWRYNQIDKRIATVNSNITALNNELGNYREGRVSVQSGGLDVFAHAVMPNSENAANTINIVMFAFIGAFLVLGLIITSWELPERTEPVNEAKQKRIKQKISRVDSETIERYIDAMVDERDEKRKSNGGYKVNGNRIIARRTGIDYNACRTYHDMIRKLRVKRGGVERPILESGGHGASWTMFSANEIKEIIREA